MGVQWCDESTSGAGGALRLTTLAIDESIKTGPGIQVSKLHAKEMGTTLTACGLNAST